MAGKKTGDSPDTQFEPDMQFEELVAANAKVIYKVCSMYACQEWPLADLYQEVVGTLWRTWPRFRGDAAPSTWFYRVALNTCISCLRRATRRPRHVPLEGVAGLFVEPESMGGEIEQLYALIQRLTTLEKAVVLLWLEERSHKEIAAITGRILKNGSPDSLSASITASANVP